MNSVTGFSGITAAHILAAVLVGLLGGVVGLGSGWLAVVLERREKLQEEEVEERRLFEKECAEARAAAASEGREEPNLPVWEAERYGWSWLEWGLNPVLMAVTWGLFTAHETLGITLVLHLAWLAVLVHVTGFDLKHRLILNRVTYPAVLVAVAASLVTPDLGLGRAVLGAVVVYVFFMVQSLAFGSRAIGQGDAKLGAFLGAVTGLGLDLQHLNALWAVIDALVFGGVVILLLLVTRIKGLRDSIPYGPFLCAGTAWVLFLGNATNTYT